LGLLTIITLEVAPFHTYAPLPALLPFFFKSILEVVSCEVFRTARDFASITSVVSKWWPLSFIFDHGNGEK
jgi:hypothetical protein